MINIAILGTSTLWTPGLVTDLMLTFDDPIDFRLIDIDPEALRLGAEWGEMATVKHGRRDQFRTFTDRRAALHDADAVIITLATGGLDVDERDINICERYRIYPTVGDSTGPSGWGRTVRNVPVFMEFAQDFTDICPRAFIANYSNPMSSLTATLQRCCPNPVVGLCHSYHQTKRFIQQLFDLETWDTISLSIAGINHFHWVTAFNIGKLDGYVELRKRIGAGRLSDLKPELFGDIYDEHGTLSVYAGMHLLVELYETYGYLPYVGDRHTAEFLPFTLSGDVERYQRDNCTGLQYDTLRYCNLMRTSSAYRRLFVPERAVRIRSMIDGTLPLPVKSSETVAEMIRAYVLNLPFTDAVNVINVGQIPGLPTGPCVETMGMIDGLGVHPVTVDNVSPPLLELLRAPALAQHWATEGAIQRDKSLLLQSLYIDPLCAHLKPHEVRSMAVELLESNRAFFALAEQAGAL